jgi:hypothetical protein
MLAPKPNDSASGVAPRQPHQTTAGSGDRQGLAGSHGTLPASGAANDALPGSGAPLLSQPTLARHVRALVVSPCPYTRRAAARWPRAGHVPGARRSGDEARPADDHAGYACLPGRRVVGRTGRRPGPRWRLTEANGGAVVAVTSGVGLRPRHTRRSTDRVMLWCRRPLRFPGSWSQMNLVSWRTPGVISIARRHPRLVLGGTRRRPAGRAAAWSRQRTWR